MKEENNAKLVLNTISSVWNNHDDEQHRQDISHYRGVGRWADDAHWVAIGNSTLKKMQMLYYNLQRPEETMSNLTILEWGPGGGANAFGLQNVASRYYGVDISEKNLAETSRQMAAQGKDNCFVPILLTDTPKSVLTVLPEKIDVFLSTAVFQHFPSKEYGIEVLQTLRSACHPRSVGIIQIRFDNDNENHKGISSIDEYKKKHITATSYKLDEFWVALEGVGFTPLFINGLNTKINYATFFIAVQ